jgi:peptidoglycan/xylan/chitin deacetylase (PgdA/CDA1 family)
MISVCFRFDDPSAISDHELERRVFAIFARQHCPLCVAVIPFARTLDGEVKPVTRHNAAHLFDAAEAGLIEIAQHGHTHVCRGSVSIGQQTEFAGISAAEQESLIAEGSNQLASVFGRRIKGFVPPWNTYDRSTAQVLTRAGFEFVSAGDYVIAAGGRLAAVPRTCTLHNARDALERAGHFHALAPVVVVLLHANNFFECRPSSSGHKQPPFIDLGQLEALLRWIHATPGMRMESLSDVAAAARNGQPLRIPREMKLPWRIKALVPPILMRSGRWTTIPAVLWGVLRSQYHEALGRRQG